MKKIVSFKKEIDFRTNISEITSISLEHTLKVEEELISGDFIVSGEYKMADISTNTEKFNFNLPFDISLDDKYILDKVAVDIDDFYYEIINDRTLVVNIDVLLDHLEEKPFIKINDESNEVNEEANRQEQITEIKEEFNSLPKIETPVITLEKIEPVIKERNKDMDIFDNFDNTENFSTYRVCIVREGDTVETIIEKYGVTKEELENYNDLTELKIGNKLIIPSK
ncbi:MAG: LysM peptidoglycan-binding domain-containing protein [Bacilli bacterium]